MVWAAFLFRHNAATRRFSTFDFDCEREREREKDTHRVNNKTIHSSEESREKKCQQAKTQQEEPTGHEWPLWSRPSYPPLSLSIHLSRDWFPSSTFGLSPQPPPPSLLETTFPIRFLSPSFLSAAHPLSMPLATATSTCVHPVIISPSRSKEKRGIRMNTNTGGIEKGKGCFFLSPHVTK